MKIKKYVGSSEYEVMNRLKTELGSDAIILDVKVGSGAFMKELDDAISLSKEMVRLGTNYGRETVAIVTNMDEPLGRAVGNSLEVKEAIDVLRGNGPDDLRELCLYIGSLLLVLAKRVNNQEEGRKLLEEVISSNLAFEKFCQLVEYQGGNVNQVKNPDLLPKSKYVIEVKSDMEGYVQFIDAERIGACALKLGAGRETMDSVIDLSVGVVLNKKVNDKVMLGETLAYIHANDLEKANEVNKEIKDIYKIDKKPGKGKKLIYGMVNKEGVQLF